MPQPRMPARSRPVSGEGRGRLTRGSSVACGSAWRPSGSKLAQLARFRLAHALGLFLLTNGLWRAPAAPTCAFARRISVSQSPVAGWRFPSCASGAAGCVADPLPGVAGSYADSRYDARLSVAALRFPSPGHSRRRGSDRPVPQFCAAQASRPQREPFICRASSRAAEGARTLDLLHGKQTL